MEGGREGGGARRASLPPLRERSGLGFRDSMLFDILALR